VITIGVFGNFYWLDNSICPLLLKSHASRCHVTFGGVLRVAFWSFSPKALLLNLQIEVRRFTLPSSRAWAKMTSSTFRSFSFRWFLISS